MLAAAAGVVLALLERPGPARFLPSPIALAVAFLVPATTSATIALGALILVVARRRSAAAETAASPLAAGAIAGEALLSLIIAILSPPAVGLESVGGCSHRIEK